MSANTLKDRCDASGPTIYRRLERLREADFVVERTRPDPDGGHHHQVYEPNLDRVTIDLEDGSLSVRITREERMEDRFTRLVEEMSPCPANPSKSFCRPVVSPPERPRRDC